MAVRRAVLLTGATGLLGRYLLRDLLAEGCPVAVLARDAVQGQAAERVRALVAFWSECLRRPLPSPHVLAGELGRDGLGLTATDRRWLGENCRAVIHAAASLSFRESLDGEPWRTNVEGTASLLTLCREAGLSEWHHVSTAFVCGRRGGLIAEDDVAISPSFYNPYEESKYQAEQLVRRTPGLRATIYRPAVVVGDSRTGFTSSFTGLYRFLELCVRLVRLHAGASNGSLPLRLPLSGDETWNLVPVDWVARAIVEVFRRPTWHGRTFHLVSQAPLSTRLVRDVGAEVLKISGVEFGGRNGVTHPTGLEQMFLDGIRQYWPYLHGNPVFSCANTTAALPDLPPPPVDRPMLERFIRFATAKHWGRRPRQKAQPTAP
jgi:thioester reductase-like protein